MVFEYNSLTADDQSGAKLVIYTPLAAGACPGEGERAAARHAALSARRHCLAGNRANHR
jgi:hypothetical protein